MKFSSFLSLIILLAFTSCSVSKKIAKEAQTVLLNDSAIRQGHIGVSIFEPATGKYLYNYNAEKYFVPASNTKLFTLYAGMKYLGDSLPGIEVLEDQDKIFLTPTGDPSFLHPDFKKQPVFDFLSAATKPLFALDPYFKITPYGSGWAWDDYNDSYMNERSSFPIFGNSIVFSGTINNFNYFPKGAVSFPENHILSGKNGNGYIDNVKRDFLKNSFSLSFEGSKKANIVIPFITSTPLAFHILADTLHKQIIASQKPIQENKKYIIYSRPTDSLFIPMMHNSDNFFAEQTLLMASNAHLGYMSDKDMIDTLLKSDLKDVPQKPKWVDGSGLSRYNLFTPKDFIYILNKIKNEFGWDRIKNILATGGTGTLKNYFIKDGGYVFAKTGTLSNNCALSGYVITKKNRLLIFSVLTNNYQTGATPVRRAVEKYIEYIREKY